MQLLKLKLLPVIVLIAGIYLLIHKDTEESSIAIPQQRPTTPPDYSAKVALNKQKIDAVTSSVDLKIDQSNHQVVPSGRISFVAIRIKRIEKMTTLSREQLSRLEQRFQMEESIKGSTISASDKLSALSALESLESILGAEIAQRYEQEQMKLRSAIGNESMHRDLLRIADENGFPDEAKIEIHSLLEQVKNLELTPFELRSYVRSALRDLYNTYGAGQGLKQYLSSLPVDIVEAPLAVSVASQELRNNELLYLQQALQLETTQVEKLQQLEAQAHKRFQDILRRKAADNADQSAPLGAEHYTQAFNEVKQQFDSDLRSILNPAQFDRYLLEQSNSSVNKLMGVD